MATQELTQEDIRVLLHAYQQGGFTTVKPAPRYWDLSEAGFLEHQTISLDAEWFGLSEQGCEALGQAASVN